MQCLALVSALLVLHAAVRADDAGWSTIEGEKCNHVSVYEDAIYCVSGPLCGSAEQITSDTSGCPLYGDKAVSGCQPEFPSFLNVTRQCFAPADAVCVQLRSGSWGCQFPTAQSIPTIHAVSISTAADDDSRNTSSSPSPASTNSLVVIAVVVVVVVGVILVQKHTAMKREAANTHDEAGENHFTSGIPTPV